MRRSLLALMLAAGVVAGPCAEAADLLPVRVGVTRGIDSGPLYIAAANVYFRDEGLDAQLKFFDTETALAAAVAAGQVDIGAAGLNASFFAAAARHDFKFLASQISDQAGYPTDALLIGKKAYESGFHGVKDLPHRRIAMTAAGAGEQYSMARIVARYRLDPHDVTLVWLKTPGREIAALSRGEVDAIALPFVTVLKLRAAGKGGGILRISDLAQRQQGVIFVRAQTITANRPLVEKFVRAYRRGVVEYDMTFQQRGDEGDVLPGPHFDEYLALIARQAGVAPDLLKYALPYCDHLGRLDLTDIERQLAFWQSEGMVDKRIAAADLLDLSFIADHIRLPPEAN
ncbi:MAG TPA: ABC transporter substrate-binding protein [Stellaceae bacterium]|nr:ABC transporter substrate-binding protein [Stellaceae bacterium]